MFKALLAARDQAFLGPIAELIDGEAEWAFAGDFEQCAERLGRETPDLVFVQLAVLDEGKADLPHSVARLRQLAPGSVMFVFRPDERGIDAAAFQTRLVHLLRFPPNRQDRDLVTQILRARRLESELDHCKGGFLPADPSDLVAFSSRKMTTVLERARAVAGMDSTVLLTGETGTGKGVLARIIHCWSRRRNSPFVSLHCSAIPETLLESELFGHEKGAFTDAVRTKPGRLDAARGGTVFLDEVATIPPAVQVKLLQVLQEKTYQRLGGEEVFKADARILAATNSDLRTEIGRGAFRADLYYRLNVFPIELPPLRERPEDIPALAHVFLKRLERTYAKGILTVDPDAMLTLQRYPWPGNIRELENAIERAYILGSPPDLAVGDLAAENSVSQASTEFSEAEDRPLTLQAVRERALEKVERAYLVELLRRHHGRINDSAAAAGVGVRQLHKLLAKHRILKEDFKQVKNR